MTAGYLRALLITDPLIIMATVVLGSVNLAASLFETDGRRQVGIARFWSRLLLKLAGVKLKIEGLEHIDPDGAYVFASNHLSFFDTPVVLGHIPVQFRFLAKKGLFQIPFLGYHLARAGHIPVPRDDARGNVKAMTEAARYIRERGVSILVFPEGGRARDIRLQPFKEGAAYIAIKAGAPLVPVALVNTQEILPMGSLHVRPGRVAMRIGEPIPTEGLTLKDRERLTQQAHQRIAILLAGTPHGPDATAVSAEHGA